MPPESLPPIQFLDLGFGEAEVVADFVEEGFAEGKPEVMPASAESLDILSKQEDLRGEVESADGMLPRDRGPHVKAEHGLGQAGAFEEFRGREVFDMDEDVLDGLLHVQREFVEDLLNHFLDLFVGIGIL